MYKKIAVIGRARVGKSRICSRFCKYNDLINRYFIGDGGDFTSINIRFVLKRECSEDGNIIKYISSESSLNGIHAHLDDEGIKTILSQINSNNTYSKNVVDKAGQAKSLNPKIDTIEITTAASDFALSIMDKHDDGVIITDTPGVSGQVEGLANLSDADLYIMVMRADNKEEYAESINKMLPVIAGSKILFIYNMQTAIEDEQDYKVMNDRAIKGMNDFVDELSKLITDSIINTSIEVLNPANTVVPMGSFSVDYTKVNFAERKFNEALSTALRESFSEASYKKEESIITKAFQNTEFKKQDLIDFIKLVIKKFPIDIGFSSETYVDKFLSERHDRVKFNDGYTTLNLVNENRINLLNKLYDYFSKLSVDSRLFKAVPKQLQETIIKYCYKKLSLSIKFDCGISRGNHPFEANPPITMWAEESVIAGDLLAANATASSSIYRKVMQQKGFTSNSWPYVSVTSSPYYGAYEYCNHKLQIIDKCKLNSLESKNTKELIYNSYNLALFKLGEYSIYQFVAETAQLSENIIDWL